MAATQTPPTATEAHRTVFVETFTDGLLGPDVAMTGPVADGGHIVVNTTPGCWGPMITPAIRGGHEVSTPVAVAGAEVGDAIAIRIRDIEVTSMATSSGNDLPMEGRFNGDPYCAPVCPGCGTEWPETRVEGIGPESVRCANCGADATPFTFTHGYTIAFDEARGLGVTVGRAEAERFARDAARFAALPDGSAQNPILGFAPHDLVALATRLRPFMGQLGTSPSATMPDSHNAGDFGAFLIGAPHRFAMTAEDVQRHKTDGHMDIDAVRAGAILVCPVKVAGRRRLHGRHARAPGRRRDRGPHLRRRRHRHARGRGRQGPGHRRPRALPRGPGPALPRSPAHRRRARRAAELARVHGVDELEDDVPISVVGSGPDLNTATDNGLARAAELLEMTVPEVRNRATIAGAIEIGRHPGVVQVTFRAPSERLEARGLLGYAREQYPAR